MRILITFLLFLYANSMFATTWYVRPNGGTRYSSFLPTGQCDGQGDADYPGTGTNQHCAFNNVNFLWQDGSYQTSASVGYPGYGWVGASGDTYLIRGSIGTGATYRVGWPNNSSAYDSTIGVRFGLQGDPYGSGPPPPINGTSGAHTRILGENYASCTSSTAKTQLHGGFAVGDIFRMYGAQYVDIACFDITDFSSCETAGGSNVCNNTIGTLDDFASVGIDWDQNAGNNSLIDVYIHGLAHNCMHGPLGGGAVINRYVQAGCPYTGWDMDNGSQGTGTLLIENSTLSWAGCAEEYPIVDAVPYTDCTDDSHGGNGDAIGTATTASSGAWIITFLNDYVFYNTQDGIDMLHLTGAGSSVIVKNTFAYGNMGQQVKVGGASGTLINSVIYMNCNAMRYAIPGTPSGYNTNLSDFCRASDEGMLGTVGPNSTLTIDDNIFYSANQTTLQLQCDSTNGPCNTTSLIDFRNNIFLGFYNSTANGYPSPVNLYPNYINDATGLSPSPFANSGSLFSNNNTFNARAGCPYSGAETLYICTDPMLVDETWHNYGLGNVQPTSSSPGKAAGVTISTIPLDILGVTRLNPPSIGAYQFNSGTSFTSFNGLSNQNITSNSINGIANQVIGSNTINSISNQGIH